MPIIRRFLEEADSGKHRFGGFASLGVSCQALDNWQLKESLQLPRGVTGVVVNRIQPLSDSSRWLKRDDVISAVDGIPVADDGSGECHGAKWQDMVFSLISCFPPLFR